MTRIFTFILSVVFCFMAAAKTSNEVIRDIRANNKAFTIRLNRLAIALLPGLRDGIWKSAASNIHSGTIVMVDGGDEDTKKKFLKSVSQLDTCTYQSLVSVNDADGEAVQMFGRMKNENIRELLIVVASDGDCTLIRLKGKITKAGIKNLIGIKNRNK